MSTGIIHQRYFNKLIRTLVRPFRKVLPEGLYFSVNGTIKIDLGEGKSMFFHGNATSNLVRLLFWYGIKGFEYDEYKIFSQVIKSANVLFDIGANLGYYSIVAKKFNPQLQVVAFEPFPSVYNYLKINLRINNLDEELRAEQLALSSSSGTARFYVSKNERMDDIADQLVGDGSLSSNVNQNPNKISFDVKTETLDNYVLNNFKSSKLVDFIKIDTEATEHLVFQGAENILRTHRPIIMCEIIKNQTEQELHTIFNRHKYLYYRILSNGLRRMDRFVIENPKDDYFLVPEEKTDLVKKYIVK